MDCIDQGITGRQLREEMESIRAGLNPHPAGQKTLNVPSLEGDQVDTSLSFVGFSMCLLHTTTTMRTAFLVCTCDACGRTARSTAV